jgi:hypothetical protein
MFFWLVLFLIACTKLKCIEDLPDNLPSSDSTFRTKALIPDKGALLETSDRTRFSRKFAACLFYSELCEDMGNVLTINMLHHNSKNLV